MSWARATPGAASLSISSHFPTIWKSMNMKPVMFPPGCAKLDETVPHTLTKLEIADPTRVHVVQPSAIPNANWLGLGDPSEGQPVRRRLAAQE
jgi:hypothetical protein